MLTNDCVLLGICRWLFVVGCWLLLLVACWLFCCCLPAAGYLQLIIYFIYWMIYN